MVGVTVDCRFGNQLFQFAFVKSLSEKLKTSYYINEQVERFILPDYFFLEGYNPWLNKLNWLLLKIQSGELLKPLSSIAVERPVKTGEEYFKDNTVYTGYFQSEEFFSNIKTEISSFLRLRETHTRYFEARYRKSFEEKRVVVIHVRRGDYLDLNHWWKDNLGSTDLSLPVDYYLSALDQVKDLESCRLIFISDDPEFVRTAFGHLKNAEFAANPLIIDFQLLTNADECILSNSSFSWWGAYLNKKPGKKVYCPEHWLGFKIQKEYPAGIIPAGWQQIAVPVNRFT